MSSSWVLSEKTTPTQAGPAAPRFAQIHRRSRLPRIVESAGEMYMRLAIVNSKVKYVYQKQQQRELTLECLFVLIIIDNYLC